MVTSLLVLRARPVRAESPGVVVVESEEAFATRIRAELTELGFSVHLVRADERPATLQELEAIAQRAHAVAAIEVSPSAGGVEIWLVDRVTGKALRREVVSAGVAGEDDEFVATRVVELLRASLLELTLPNRAPGEVNATPELRRAAQLPVATPEARSRPGRRSEAGRSVSFEGGIGLMSNTDPGMSLPFVDMGAFFRATESVSVGLSGLVSVAGKTVSETEGKARITTWSVRAGARIEPFSRANRVQPFVGSELGILAFRVEGQDAQSGYHTATDQLISAAPELELGVGLRLSRAFGVRSTFGAAYAFPKPVVHFADRETLVLGRPAIMLSLEFEYRAVWEATRD